MACSCPAGDVSVEEAFDASDLVFVGKVQELAAGFYQEDVHATLFSPIAVYKGSAEGKAIPIAMVGTPDTCDLTFWQGKEYIVYASFDQYHIYRASICSRTNFSAGADAEREKLAKLAKDTLRNLPPGIGKLTPFPAKQ